MIPGGALLMRYVISRRKDNERAALMLSERRACSAALVESKRTANGASS